MLRLIDRPGTFANRNDTDGHACQSNLWSFNRPDTSINGINVLNVHVKHSHGNRNHPGFYSNGLSYWIYVKQPAVNMSTATHGRMDGALNITNSLE